MKYFFYNFKCIYCDGPMSLVCLSIHIILQALIILTYFDSFVFQPMNECMLGSNVQCT